MSDATTLRMLEAYLKIAKPTMFLSGFFRTPPNNFHNSEEIEIDILRSKEDVSIVITDLSTGYKMNSADVYTNKRFIPPIHKEAMPISAFDLIKRVPGQNPFADPNFQINASTRALTAFSLMEAKIRRSIEWQASQVLQIGVVTLIDSGGNTVYTIDYKPKATHFPTSGTAWDNSGDPIADLLSLCNVIRADGLADPDQIIMGELAFEEALANSNFKAKFDTRRAELGTISPMQMNNRGGQYRGVVEVGTYRLDIWTYGARYTKPDDGVSTRFIDPIKVIVRVSTARLDGTFGAIPMIVPPDQRVLPFLPGRIANTEGGLDMHNNAWVTPDGEQLFVGVGTRPLMIPTDIDSYGTLNTGITP